MKLFYRPSRIYILTDLFVLFLSFYIVLDWFPLTSSSPFDKYSFPSLFYTLAWVLMSYLFKRYKPVRKQGYFKAMSSLFYVCSILFFLFFGLIHFYFKAYSGYVLLIFTLELFLVNYIIHSLYFAYRFAYEYNDFPDPSLTEIRENAKARPSQIVDEMNYEQLCSSIQLHSGISVLKFLKKQVELKSSNTMVYVSTDLENLIMLPSYQYSTIVQLERLNNCRKVNRKFKVINEKLADDGIFVCCFESKSTRKKRLLEAYPSALKYIIYSFDFLFSRVMPKMVVTRPLYYFLTKGKNRIFSKTEVLGRLYCNGFAVIHEKKIGQLTYVVSKRIKQPEHAQKRIYGPLIRLHRYGKNGTPFIVYKMRTMHPFSEYLQEYIYSKNSLKEGGKFNKDIRVTTTGNRMRKYWLDELPMIYNLLKGDMKLVGVRPLSAQYFSLYDKELQAKRNKYKPGLLPPFYADMPKTLEEIQASEMKYLKACEEQGELITDFKYFFRILNNILIKKARSS